MSPVSLLEMHRLSLIPDQWSRACSFEQDPYVTPVHILVGQAPLLLAYIQSCSLPTMAQTLLPLESLPLTPLALVRGLLSHTQPIPIPHPHHVVAWISSVLPSLLL